MFDDQPWIVPALVMLGSYLLGAIPFGLIVTKLAGAGDLRTIGSGNIGATNVLRTGRKGLAALTLLLDAAKGAAAVLLAGSISPQFVPLAGTGVFLGHLYPVWLRFRGGKGVATLLGIVLAIHWPCAAVFVPVWLLMLWATRYSSVAGMAAAVSAPVAAAFYGKFELVILYMALALLLLWQHRGNIERLLAGTEPKVGGANA